MPDDEARDLLVVHAADGESITEVAFPVDQASQKQRLGIELAVDYNAAQHPRIPSPANVRSYLATSYLGPVEEQHAGRDLPPIMDHDGIEFHLAMTYSRLC